MEFKNKTLIRKKISVHMKNDEKLDLKIPIVVYLLILCFQYLPNSTDLLNKHKKPPANHRVAQLYKMLL